MKIIVGATVTDEVFNKYKKELTTNNKTMKNTKEFILIEDRRWNNQGVTIKAIGTEDELFKWVLDNTCHSYSNALEEQGYYTIPLTNDYQSYKLNK